MISVQYYFSEADIGQNRAEVTLKKLRELNSYVSVSATPATINEQYLTDNNVNV